MDWIGGRKKKGSMKKSIYIRKKDLQSYKTSSIIKNCQI